MPNFEKSNPLFSKKLEADNTTIGIEKFLKDIGSIEASSEEVNGKIREYVKLNELYPVYEQDFGSRALTKNAIMYRVKRIGEEKYPDDLYIIPEDVSAAYEPRYFVNRLNTDLLKEIYEPGKSSDNMDDMVSSVKELEEYSQGRSEMYDMDPEDFEHTDDQLKGI